MSKINHSKKIDELISFAMAAGATKAACLSPEQIRIENRLADFCVEPKCPNYRLSMSCPPNVSGPVGMKKLIKKSSYALILRLEVDAASLTGDDRTTVFRLLHEISAAVETEAKRIGFQWARGFAGGSCKQSFCRDHEFCRVLNEKKGCRYPLQARSSMSGYGVNVGELMESGGWSSELFSSTEQDKTEQLSWIAGLVLLQ